MEKYFSVTRIYSDAAGESYFEDVSIPLKNSGDIGSLSKAFPAKDIFFREVDAAYDYDFHVAPQEQYIVLLDGEIEIETSLGEKRTFTGGDILLLQDITGKGHRTKNLLPVKRKSIFITV